MTSDLQKAVLKLKAKPELQPAVERIAGELHDIFEAILVTALTENAGEQIDGAAVLAILMRCFKEVSQPPEITTTVPVISGLPSQNARNNLSS